MNLWSFSYSNIQKKKELHTKIDYNFLNYYSGESIFEYFGAYSRVHNDFINRSQTGNEF